jgi:hypothetical protein
MTVHPNFVLLWGPASGRHADVALGQGASGSTGQSWQARPRLAGGSWGPDRPALSSLSASCSRSGPPKMDQEGLAGSTGLHRLFLSHCPL